MTGARGRTPLAAFVALATRRTWLRALPFVALIVLASVLSYRYHALLSEERLRVEHTYEVLTRLDATLVAAIDAETGQRGYVLTGDERYLQPYRDALVEVPRALDALGTLVVDSSEQLRRLADLRRQIAIKFAELEETIEARRRDGLDAARDVVMRDRGRVAMDALRNELGAMKAHELDLLERRDGEVRHTEHLLLAITLACAALSIAARIGMAHLARRAA